MAGVGFWGGWGAMKRFSGAIKAGGASGSLGVAPAAAAVSNF
jgi:hypothetical protein